MGFERQTTHGAGCEEGTGTAASSTSSSGEVTGFPAVVLVMLRSLAKRREAATKKDKQKRFFSYIWNVQYKFNRKNKHSLKIIFTVFNN